MGDIGQPRRTIEAPEPVPHQQPEREPVKAPEPEKAPAEPVPA